MTDQCIRVRAFAKINVDLTIVGTRPDGYHEIRTTFQSIDLHDTLTFVPTPGPFRIVSTAAGVPVTRDNVIWTAAAALWREAGRRGDPEGLDVWLEKRIPPQGGLGGGSADAAATLRALVGVWAGNLTPGRLDELAGAIGSDVPFFLHGGTARGTGRGDRLELLDDRSPRSVVLVCPPFGVSTVEAYRWFDETTSGPSDAGSGAMSNDLEPPVTRRHPEIASIRAALVEAGASLAAMSGSGSTVFGEFVDESRARDALHRLSGGASRCILTRTLSRAEWAERTAPERVPLAGFRLSPE